MSATGIIALHQWKLEKSKIAGLWVLDAQPVVKLRMLLQRCSSESSFLHGTKLPVNFSKTCPGIEWSSAICTTQILLPRAANPTRDTNHFIREEQNWPEILLQSIKVYERQNSPREGKITQVVFHQASCSEESKLLIFVPDFLRHGIVFRCCQYSFDFRYIFIS